jgi:methylthioribose-1-phosphate isomerase
MECHQTHEGISHLSPLSPLLSDALYFVLQIRGAPAIASCAALAIAVELLAFLSGSPKSIALDASQSPAALHDAVKDVTAYLLTSRPTAVNLQEALSRINKAAEDGVKGGLSTTALADKIIEVAKGVWSEDVARNHSIGDKGAAWLLNKLEEEGSIQKGQKINVLTVRVVGFEDNSFLPLSLTGLFTGLQHWLSCYLCQFPFSYRIYFTSS